ncbi:hypothetical protein [Novipirellula rosea]|uniref:HTH domain protein n=1 Tax=Novipirellula rosea TaxID=1031540 RepID=A0ABP8MSI8_9BACT
MATLRRYEIVRRLRHIDLDQRGWRTELAAELGISRWTLSADLRAIRRDTKAARTERIDADFKQRETFMNLLESSQQPDPVRDTALQRRRDQRSIERLQAAQAMRKATK